MPKIFHVVMEHGTVTFLDYDSMVEFLGNTPVGKVDESMVLCESEVTGEEYNRMSAWHGAISKEDA